MKTDVQIKKDILDEFDFLPNIDETQIGVLVNEGVVNLTGTVDSYTKKYAAREAVKRVKGVRAIAEDLVVKHGQEYKKTDQDVARRVANFLEWNTAVHKDNIIVEVRNGIVYLKGEATSYYEKQAANQAIHDLIGVRGVVNDITIKPTIQSAEIKENILQAFKRLAGLDTENITVTVDDQTVKLQGKVRSLAEKDEAYKTAYNAPGISNVKNELHVVV